MKTFSYRIRSLLGVEGAFNTTSYQLTLRVVVLGSTFAIEGGPTADTAQAIRNLLARFRTES